MTIEQLLQLAQVRLANVSSQLTSALSLGDVAQIERLSAEVSDTEQTIEKLKSLL
jgi:cell division protein FtsB